VGRLIEQRQTMKASLRRETTLGRLRIAKRFQMGHWRNAANGVAF
jgi:hypothetical protein